MGVSVDVTYESRFGEFAAGFTERLARGETLAAERLGALSVAEAPLDIGTLIGSQSVVPAVDPDEGAAVVYDTPYAARLHEHPEFNFQNGRKGKYLEDPAMQNRDELGAIIAKEANGA